VRSGRRIAAAALAAGLLLPAVARADGDPASDFLVVQDAFVPSDGGIPAADSAQLTGLLRAAKAKGFRIKVALIPKRDDLGAVTILWLKPKQYAKFLGTELFYVFDGRLLIVMPNGYGVYDHKRPVAGDRKLLDALRLPKSASDEAAAASTAVRRLAAQDGIALALPARGTRSSSNNRDRIAIVLIAVCAAALGALIFLPRRRRRALDGRPR